MAPVLTKLFFGVRLDAYCLPQPEHLSWPCSDSDQTWLMMGFLLLFQRRVLRRKVTRCYSTSILRRTKPILSSTRHQITGRRLDRMLVRTADFERITHRQPGRC